MGSQVVPTHACRSGLLLPGGVWRARLADRKRAIPVPGKTTRTGRRPRLAHSGAWQPSATPAPFPSRFKPQALARATLTPTHRTLPRSLRSRGATPGALRRVGVPGKKKNAPARPGQSRRRGCDRLPGGAPPLGHRGIEVERHGAALLLELAPGAARDLPHDLERVALGIADFVAPVSNSAVRAPNSASRSRTVTRSSMAGTRDGFSGHGGLLAATAQQSADW